MRESQVKEGMQSYYVGLCSVRAVSLYLVFKELIDKHISP